MTLKTELAEDPEGRGYNGPGVANPGPDPMSDIQIVTDINTTYRERDRASLTGSEVYQAVDDTELAALTSDERIEVWNILHLDNLDPFGHEASRFQTIFPVGGATILALQAVRKESITRAQELGLGIVHLGHVEAARM